jgi:subtilisin family serine protease
MKKKTVLTILISLAVLLIIAVTGYVFLISPEPKTTDEEITELGSVYISENADSPQLQVETESETETEETINPEKKGELTVNENRKVVNFDTELTDEEKLQIEEDYDIQFTTDQSIKGTYSVITNDESKIELLEKDEKVASVETDVPVRMFADTQDWGIVRIGASKVWDEGSGSGVTVAVIDTGIQLTHPDLSTNIVSGYDFVNNDSSATDDNGHGTHVAGIVASTMNGAGNVGASYSAKLMPVKVLNESGYGYLSDVAKGIYYAADNGARVINMSLGAAYDSDTLRRAVQYAANKGVLLVGAAGNESSSPCLYPAAYSSVICVVATDQYNKLASFSNLGGELAAPGVSNYSTYINSSYAKLSGTSMASPHVAGSAALVMSVCTECSTSEVRDLLRSTATDLGSEGYDIIFGHGLVNLVDAIENLVPEEEEPIDDNEETPEEETPTEEPPTSPGQGNLDIDRGKPNEPTEEIDLDIVTPITNPSRRYIVRSRADIDLEFKISPTDQTVSAYKIYLNNEEVEDYDGDSTKYTFDIEEMEYTQYQLRVEALLEDSSTVSDSILLDLTHLSRGRSVKGISTFSNWIMRLFFN